MTVGGPEPTPVVSYVLRTFPVPSETFVVRELLALRDAGVPLEIWSLLPPAVDAAWDAVPEAAPLRSLVREVPRGGVGLVRLLGALASAFLRRPVATLRATGWALWWAIRGRDPRTVAALPYAAHVARHAAAPHLHAHFANTPTTTAVLASILSGRTCSYTGHARDLWAVTSPAFLAAKTRRCSFAASGTQYALDRIRDACEPGDVPRLTVVRSIVDAPDEPPNVETLHRAVPNFDVGPAGRVDEEAATVVCVARLVEKKGIDVLLRAFAEIVGRPDEADDVVSTVRLELIGDGPLRGDCEALARSLGTAGRVVFRGALPAPAVAAALDRATVFALLARETEDGDSDGLPVAILEAQAHGVPVVSTPVAGIPEAITDGETGLLVPPGNVPAAAVALRRLLVDPRLRADLASKARAQVVRRHTSASAIEPLVALFATAGISR